MTTTTTTTTTITREYDHDDHLKSSSYNNSNDANNGTDINNISNNSSNSHKYATNKGKHNVPFVPPPPGPHLCPADFSFSSHSSSNYKAWVGHLYA